MCRREGIVANLYYRWSKEFLEAGKKPCGHLGMSRVLNQELKTSFGVRRRTVASYEAHVAKLDNRSGFIDLFWPGVLVVEQKSSGRDLKKAYGQAIDYLLALPERNHPRFILVSDFQDLRAPRS